MFDFTMPDTDFPLSCGTQSLLCRLIASNDFSMRFRAARIGAAATLSAALIHIRRRFYCFNIEMAKSGPKTNNKNWTIISEREADAIKIM